MAYTQADLDAIKTAIASGALSVEIDGQKIVYRSFFELERAEARIRREVFGPTSRPRSVQARFRRE
ncbi:phage head-tail joining protein [Kiloniella sp.]|uniref:phage head-tail joining protein n=1 Tax=Kiloniella sp. TaxID=1938587 RepID=UPI003B02C722